MSGTDGLTDIEVSSIQIQYGLGVGQNSNEGLDGQVLSSQGRDKPMRWVNQTGGALETLTQGSGITISPDGEYDGSVAQTITATFPAFTGGSGITIDETGVITTNNDGTTMTNTGGDGGQNAVLKVPNDLTAGSNISFSSGTTYNGSSAITISSTDNSFYTRIFPNPLYQFPSPPTATNWYSGGYGFTAFHPDFYIDIPATATDYENFKVVVSIYEEERIAGRRFNTTDNRNGLIDFVDGTGVRISPVYFFQSGAGFNTQTGSNPNASQVIGGRGAIQFSCILSLSPAPRPSTTRIQPRFSNSGIDAEASSHHLFQAGEDGSFDPTGVIHKKEWILETHPINNSNFRNITT
tara:strand:- start:1665 stop:2717 length:1053 start_codon:yes stop_codon:yes gene_type:complete